MVQKTRPEHFSYSEQFETPFKRFWKEQLVFIEYTIADDEKSKKSSSYIFTFYSTIFLKK